MDRELPQHMKLETSRTFSVAALKLPRLIRALESRRTVPLRRQKPRPGVPSDPAFQRVGASAFIDDGPAEFIGSPRAAVTTVRTFYTSSSRA